MKTSHRGVDLIKSFEKCELKAYRCPAGVWTIGWGHTGPDVFAGLCITRERADELLAADLERFERSVCDALAVRVTQSQFDALVSFAYNIGADALRKSTLMRMLSAGDVAGAAEQFERWNKAGGKVLAGLTRRRLAERDLFLSAA